MEPLLENIKVVELAMWAFGPSSAAILADWGAEVIKIEAPGSGDPMRGLLESQGMSSADGHNFYFAQYNRSKRGIGLDVGNAEGHKIFCKLIEEADVFITSFLEPARQRLKVTYEDLSAINPRLIYARGHGQGQRGPQAYAAGFDAASYWARSGVAHMASPVGGPFIPMPAGAFGDVQGGLAMAAGVAAALYRRSVTGKGGLIDVSLFSMGCWAMAAGILGSHQFGIDAKSVAPATPRNPLVGSYITSDDRWISLVMLDADRYWPGFCRAMSREELIEDARFHSFDARGDNRDALMGLIVDEFRSRTLAGWKERLTKHECVFAIAQSPLEIIDDPQAVANSYVINEPGSRHVLVSSPVQYNNGVVEATRAAPEPGEHTEEVLLELGYDWDQIIALKDAGAIN